MESTPEMIFYIVLIVLVLILIILILTVLVYVLLRKYYTIQKMDQCDAEDIFFVPNDDSFHIPGNIQRKTRNSNSAELQKHPSAYIFLNNKKKININTDEFFVGFSKSNNLTINEPGISQTHCKIKSTGDEFYIFDLISQTGTFLNGKKVLRTRELNDWDEIRIGNTLLVFRKIQYI